MAGKNVSVNKNSGLLKLSIIKEYKTTLVFSNITILPTYLPPEL